MKEEVESKRLDEEGEMEEGWGRKIRGCGNGIEGRKGMGEE